jgi:hypothetical protein
VKDRCIAKSPLAREAEMISCSIGRPLRLFAV